MQARAAALQALLRHSEVLSEESSFNAVAKFWILRFAQNDDAYVLQTKSAQATPLRTAPSMVAG